MKIFRTSSALSLLVLAALATAMSSNALRAQASEPAQPRCTNCATWNAEQPPFRIYGSTYYVGPHGLSAILIASPSGHILIDGALPESAQQIENHLRMLGFRLEDVKVILSSHVHFDHAGGIAELQRVTGATVMASPWSATVLTRGGVDPGDPQLGDIRGIDKVASVKVLHDGETVRVGPLALTAHFTPGHTPGGTSWTWRSCEGERCYNMVYADSVSPVSADNFKFSHNTSYPNVLQDFEKTFAFLDTVPCDVLLTAHPEVAGLWDKMAERKTRKTPDPLVDTGQCHALAEQGRLQLQQRIAKEGARTP